MHRTGQGPVVGSLLLALCTAVSGCMQLAGPGRAAWNVTDPCWQSPQLQPLYAPRPAPSHALQAPRGRMRTQRPVLPPRALPREDRPQPAAPSREPDEPPAGPRLLPPESVRPSGLTLEISAPAQMQRGSAVRFQVAVRNTGTVAADEVTVTCEFGAALQFSRSGERRVRQSLGRIVPGERKQIALTLYAQETGTHCARFTAKAGAIEAAAETVCVEIVPRRLEMQIVGPPERTVGSRAEFTFKLANTSAETLAGLTATVRYDAALVPREASTGAVTGPGTLTWRLGDLEPDEGVQLQTEFESRVAAENACLSLEVTGAAMSTERLERCLRVVPSQGRLDLRVADTADPVAVGDETVYEVTLQNRGVQPLRDVVVSAEVPLNVRVVSTEVRRGEQVLPLAGTVEGNEIRFAAVESLAGDDVLTYRIRVKAVRAGDVAFHARATHAADDTPAETVEATTVNP